MPAACQAPPRCFHPHVLDVEPFGGSPHAPPTHTPPRLHASTRTAAATNRRLGKLLAGVFGGMCEGCIPQCIGCDDNGNECDENVSV